MKCSHCEGVVYAKGLCTQHYRQQLRGKLGTTRDYARGDADQITFACRKSIKQKLTERAKGEGISTGEWLRRLVESALGA